MTAVKPYSLARHAPRIEEMICIKMLAMLDKVHDTACQPIPHQRTMLQPARRMP